VPTPTKTKTLAGRPLDWAVATALNREPVLDMTSHGLQWPGWWLRTGGEYQEMPFYTRDWADGGPILERAGIATRKSSKGIWHAMLSSDLGDRITAPWVDLAFTNVEKTEVSTRECRFSGRSLLEAGLRCWVTSKLGDVVDLPDELIQAETEQPDEPDEPPTPHERG
jgi:hypothetical protein